ncbi:MAG: cation:proton antiporter, partial [Lentisphaeria bacterium]|nr:cation:proton antiporter [Lentisphaeria bacterium]
MELLLLLVILLSLIIVIGMVNTRFFRMPSDIALVAFSLIIGIILVAPEHFGWWDWDVEFITEVDIEHFLLEGVLCFMLFSGASKVHFSKFISNIKPIMLLALLTTLISSTFYGLLFYVFSLIAHLPLNFWTCVLLGCIVSPTDPIAAT